MTGTNYWVLVRSVLYRVGTKISIQMTLPSLEILKDATSTAIYGARGANGVVLVTTKRGNNNGKTTISYDAYGGVTDPLDKVHLFTGPEFTEYVREAYRATNLYNDAIGKPVPTGVADAFADSKVAVLGGDPAVAAGIAANRNTDYQSLILRQGRTAKSLDWYSGRNRKNAVLHICRLLSGQGNCSWPGLHALFPQS